MIIQVLKSLKKKKDNKQKNEVNQKSYINLKDSQNDDFEYNKLNNSDDTISSNSSISNDILNHSLISLSNNENDNNINEDENNNINFIAPWLTEKTKKLSGIIRLHQEIFRFL